MNGTRISSLLGKITVLFFICFFGLSAQAKYGGGTGEPNDPYLIFDANQMNAIGADSNDWDKCFKLMADIDLSSYTGTSFNIIGIDYDNPFRGVFDGNGHTISNFTYISTDRDYIGLFGFVRGENAVIKDLGLIAPNVDAETTNYFDVGPLVGGMADGTITGCYVEGGSVAGNAVVGGLVGMNFYGTIVNCYSTASVSGTTDVGGLVGSNDYGTITNCYSSSTVLGSGATDWYGGVGGLVGKNNSGTITNCYSTGSVSGDDSVGGLVGENGYYFCDLWSDEFELLIVLPQWDCWWVPGRITNCYSTGSVSGKNYVGGLVGGYGGEVTGSFWDIETSGQATSSGGTGKATVEMQTSSTFIGWGCEPVWTIDDGNDYPRLLWEKKPGKIITKISYGGGSGEPNDPYLIYTAEQLNMIGLFLCDLDKHFMLMADIDLSWYTGTSFNIIGAGWSNPFTGVFDGSGHTISNFTYTSPGTSYIGLFGYVDDPNAEIKNLGLIDPNVDAGTGDYVGSLVGWLQEGKITGCYVEGGSVSGDDYVGGLVGGGGGTISNCHSEGSVLGTTEVGGLVGANGGTISNCYSSGSVTGTTTVGGLVGGNSYFGTITNCYSSGSALGDLYVGGLVGENGSIFVLYSLITNSYSIGLVVGTGDHIGGLVGDNHDGTGEVKYSFWDVNSSAETSSDGGTGLPTAEMQMQITFTDADWDFVTPVWTIDEGVDYPRLWWETSPVLHAEPEVTLGTTNTISWEPVPGANDYYAECSEDANFTSIIYNTGWITEASCEFTGLELGQIYWYSVKARNVSGVETNWSNVESSLQGTLADAVDIMLAPDTLKNKNMKNALLNKINAVLKMLDVGRYEEALNKLRNDILQKTNGCALTGEPDKNDWIITCEGQSRFYPLVIETIEYVRGLME